MTGSWRRTNGDVQYHAHWYQRGASACATTEKGSHPVTMVAETVLTAHGVPYGLVCAFCLRRYQAAERSQRRAAP